MQKTEKIKEFFSFIQSYQKNFIYYDSFKYFIQKSNELVPIKKLRKTIWHWFQRTGKENDNLFLLKVNTMLYYGIIWKFKEVKTFKVMPNLLAENLKRDQSC